MKDTKTITITVVSGEIATDSYIAMAKCGGVVTRSGRNANALDAVKNAVQQLITTGDGEFGIALALDGTTLDDVKMDMLPEGDKPTP